MRRRDLRRALAIVAIGVLAITATALAAPTATQVTDINPGSGGSFPRELTKVGDTLMFAAKDDIHGVELWRSDGTETGTTLVKDINPGTGSS